MSGRYGFDQFSGFLCIASLILIVIGPWVSPVLYWLGLAAIIYSYFRILSRNTRKRYAENLKYLSYQSRAAAWFAKQQVRFKQRKEYHYYRCPQCGQQLRVPRGRGQRQLCADGGKGRIKYFGASSDQFGADRALLFGYPKTRQERGRRSLRVK